jgi:hypothetical protein
VTFHASSGERSLKWRLSVNSKRLISAVSLHALNQLVNQLILAQPITRGVSGKPDPVT